MMKIVSESYLKQIPFGTWTKLIIKKTFCIETLQCTFGENAFVISKERKTFTKKTCHPFVNFRSYWPGRDLQNTGFSKRFTYYRTNKFKLRNFRDLPCRTWRIRRMHWSCRTPNHTIWSSDGDRSNCIFKLTQIVLNYVQT